MTVIRISLAQQLEAVRFAETRQRAFANGQIVRPQRRAAEEQHDLVRLGAAARTLQWLATHEGEIRKLLEMPPERRALLWSHMGDVAELLDAKGEASSGDEAA